MIDKRYTTRTFVISPEEELICLTYRLTADPLKSDYFEIEVSQTGCRGEDRVSGKIGCSEWEAMELVERFAANSVFPFSLPDLLEDRLAQ